MAPDTIFGRGSELTAVARFLEGTANGPRALQIEGEAGIGKTTIWGEAVRIAGADSRVLVSRASESETKLSFTVLTDLFGPILEEIGGELPEPQRRAMRTALLLDAPAAGEQPGARAVSLGTLGALRALAGRVPVTLAVDDVQWTDAPSARALSFALRRLTDELVTVIVASRTAPGFPEPLSLRDMMTIHTLALGPVAADPLGGILRRLDRAFPRPLLSRIHDASGGNPLFALEIGRALVRSGVRPKPGEPLPIPDDVRVLLRDRLASLDPDAREALLVAACSATPTVELVGEMGGTDLALEEAERHGIIFIRGSAIEFTHPLLASTVYADAPSSSRRDVHRRLAAIAIDPEEGARHLALSSRGPNPEVASALDRAAVRARARGAPQAAAELGELALAATAPADLPGRQRRMKAQAGNLFDAGDPPRARELLEELLGLVEPGAPRAETLFLLSGFCWKDMQRVSGLLNTALQEVGDDPRLRSRILSDLAWVGLDTGDLAAAAARGREALELASALEDDRYGLRHSLSVLALTEFVLGHERRELLDSAISLQDPLSSADLSSPATCLGRQLTWVGELGAARETLRSELDRYRDQGHETSRYEILAHLADVECRAGRFDRAARHLDEAEDIAMEAGVDVLGEILPVRAAVECSVGDLDGARLHAMEGLAVCDRTVDRWNEIRCRSVLGFLEISRDDPVAAHAWLEPLPEVIQQMGVGEPGVFPFVPDAVEALVGIGELDRAKELTQRLEEQGREQHRPLAIGTAIRCHALIEAALGDLPGAASSLERSREELRHVPHPLELARTLLIAGEVQRRMKKKSSTREMLAAALSIFEEIGAELWAEKARHGLARIGGRAPSPLDLTAREEQVAFLVAEGRTNREVASSLFMSVNTVEAHLKRIYRKLGVRSRVELARRLGERAGS